MGARRAKSPAQRMVRNSVDEVAIAQGCWYDQTAADEVIRFFDLLCLTVAPFEGQPFTLQEWQVEILNQTFGWKRPNGTRRFREVYIEIPKKNGKSAFASGLALQGLIEEVGARVFCGTRNQPQALEVFDEAARMVRQAPHLLKHLDVRDSTHTILFRAREASIKTLTADAPGQDGKNASRVILDELHQMPSRKLYDVIKYAGKARKQPLLFSITTAGNSKAGICWEVHERARKVIKGIDTTNIRFLPIIFAAEEGDDLEDEKVWRKANPALGVILNIDDFREDVREAKQDPEAWRYLKRTGLNLWQEKSSDWLDVELWDQVAAEITPATFIGRRTFATIDLSSGNDLSAITLTTVFPRPLEPDLVCQLTVYFCPEGNIDRRSERDGVPYRQWVEEGWLIATPGYAVDQDAMRDKLNELRDLGIEIVQVGADPWNLGWLEAKLPQDGFDLVKISQRISTLTASCKEFQRLILTGEIRHEGNPITRWCVGNATVVRDAAGNIMYDKAKAPEKIDGVATSVMGAGLAMVDQAPQTPVVTLYDR